MCQAGAQVDEKDGLYLKLPESRKDAQPLPQGQVCAAREAGTWGTWGKEPGSAQGSTGGGRPMRRCATQGSVK